MQLSAGHKPNRLPKRFPVGTTYVVEGSGGEHGELRVFSRYVVLPGGQRINLVDDFGGNFAGPACPAGAPAAARRAATEPQPGQRAPPAGQRKLWFEPEPLASAPVNSSDAGRSPQPLTLNHPASNPGRISGRGSSFLGSAQVAAGAHLFPAHDQIVAMDHLGPAGKAQDRIDVGGRAALDLLRIFGVVGR